MSLEGRRPLGSHLGIDIVGAAEAVMRLAADA